MQNIEKYNKRSDKTKTITNIRGLTIEMGIPEREGKEEKQSRKGAK